MFEEFVFVNETIYLIGRRILCEIRTKKREINFYEVNNIGMID